MSKIALNMIAKGDDEEALLLDKCLASASKYVDGIFIVLNSPAGVNPSEKALAVCKKHKAVVSTAVWKDNFTDMRNLALALVPKDFDWVLWLDADDTLVVDKGSDLHTLADNAKGFDSLFAKYEYQFDEQGNCVYEHWVTRMFKNNDSVIWQGHYVHETPIEVRNTRKASVNEFHVEHHAELERRDKSLARNIKLLEKALMEEKETDPRILFYLGCSYVDNGSLKAAIEIFHKYLELSGWDKERAQAYLLLGQSYAEMGQIDEAKKCYLGALGEDPYYISAYVEMGSWELGRQQWRKAIIWLEMAVSIKPEINSLAKAPLDSTWRPYMLLGEANLNLGGSNIKTALKWANMAIKVRDEPSTRNFRDLCATAVKERNAINNLLDFENRHTHDPKAVIKELDAMDADYQTNPAVLELRKKYCPPKVWPKKSIAIYTGSNVLSGWGPWSLESGIGGSEEAVIHLSQELTKMGWQVTVYAEPYAKAGVYDGVTWKNIWELDNRDVFDVFVGWRCPWFFDEKIEARKTYLWLHDVTDEAELTKERLDNITKIMVLGAYHRSLFPNIPDDKFFLTGNGIDPAEFMTGKNNIGDIEFGGDGLTENMKEYRLNNVKRNPHRIVYMSSHERGQEHLQDIWLDVKKEVPDAECHCMYGWESFVAVQGNNPAMMAWKESIDKKTKELPDFYDHGRVGHGRVVEEIYKSGVWAYPSGFPEVYCITAVKAQAGGAVPVCSDYAALDENVKYGAKVHMVPPINKKDLKTYTKTLIKVLKDEKYQQSIRGEMKEWALTNRSWKATARGWDKEFAVDSATEQ